MGDIGEQGSSKFGGLRLLRGASKQEVNEGEGRGSLVVAYALCKTRRRGLVLFFEMKNGKMYN